MDTVITRKDWEEQPVVCLSKGRAGNARVYRVEASGGAVVIKDFRKSPWWIRWTWGRWMIGHEYALLKRLEGVDGIPQRVFRVDAYAFGMELLPGRSLGDINQTNIDIARGTAPAGAVKHVLPASFFRKLERLMCAIHRRGVTHLDSRNAKNVLVLPDDSPALIDFQSGVVLRKWHPRCVRTILKLADISSVYKHYYRYFMGDDGRMPEVPGGFPLSRAKLFLSHMKLRKLWVLKGYSFVSKRKPKGFELHMQAYVAAQEEAREKGGQ